MTGERDASAARRSSRMIILTGLAMLAALWAVILASLFLIAGEDSERARREAENAASLFAEQVERAILFADMTLRLAALDLAREPRPDALAQLLREEQIELGPLLEIAFIDSSGRLVATHRGPESAGLSLADRLYVSAHRDLATQGLVIDIPEFGLPMGQWIIPLTRRVDDAQGRLVGVVRASLNPDYFARFWRGLDPAGTLAARLIDMTGRVYASTGDLLSIVETGARRTDDIEHLRHVAEGVAEPRKQDGRIVFSAFRSVRSGFVVTADKEAPSFWSDSVRYTVLLGLWATGFVILLFGWIWRVTAKLSATESRAVRSEARLRNAIDSLTDGFGIADPKGRIVVMNEAMRTFYAGPPEDVHVGADYFELRRKTRASGRVSDEWDREVLYSEQQLAALSRKGHGVRFQRIDDRYVRIIERKTPDGDTVSVRTDVTEMKRREEELRRSRAILEAQARDLKAMAARAEEATQAKSAFVAAMSHEIRTPLNAIVGFGDLLARADLPAEQKNFATIIRDSSHHLLRLADDILDFERLGANRVVLKNEPFDLVAGLYGIADVTSGLVAGRPVEIRAKVPPETPERAVGDWLRLKQILINLMGNAAKFTREGEIELSVEPLGGGRMRFSVRDTGPGVPPAERAAIFELFEQGSAAGRHGGSGLGLAIARRLVALMGGELRLDTELGKGSTFSFDIPLPSAPAPLAVVARAIAGPRPHGPRRRILVADDVASARLLISTLLRLRGHDVVAVEDGLEALAAAKAQRFDAIVLDLQMPNMDGLEAARLIRKLPPPHGEAPIFGFSAQVLDQDRAAAVAAGMKGFLPKPLREDALDRMLESLDSAEGHAASPAKAAAAASATRL